MMLKLTLYGTDSQSAAVLVIRVSDNRWEVKPGPSS